MNTFVWNIKVMTDMSVKVSDFKVRLKIHIQIGCIFVFVVFEYIKLNWFRGIGVHFCICSDGILVM